jgi:RNA polymerase sigma-54 factor
VLLQPKLNLKVSQRQVLTPGLVQMVSVLALNKLELKEMINTEIVENPVLEEIEDTGVSLDERAGMEGDRERSAEDVVAESERPEKDPFEEIDFGNYFQEYLDPGYRTSSNFEEYDKPSFENFLSQPSTLSDHLMWQLGSLTLDPELAAAAELVVGNLNENGYLTATDEELVDSLLQLMLPAPPDPIPFERGSRTRGAALWSESGDVSGDGGDVEIAAAAEENREASRSGSMRRIVNNPDPVGVGARDLANLMIPPPRRMKPPWYCADARLRRKTEPATVLSDPRWRSYRHFRYGEPYCHSPSCPAAEKGHARVDAKLRSYTGGGAGGGRFHSHS